MNKTRISIILAVSLVSACSNTVYFGTKTSLSVVEIDSTANVNGIAIGYDRVEGILSRNTENQTSELPAAFSYIYSDGSIFNPEITQIYATGIAAESTLGGDPTGHDCEDVIEKKEKLSFAFYTYTNTGLKIGYEDGVAFNLGFKRKEASALPMIECPDTGKHIFPSTFTHIETGAKTENGKAGLKTRQIFASGKAAKLLGKELSADTLKRINTHLSADDESRQ